MKLTLTVSISVNMRPLPFASSSSVVKKGLILSFELNVVVAKKVRVPFN